MEEAMFHGKMHDEEDDELPRYEEEGEEGLGHSNEGIVEEVEEIVIEGEPAEEEEPAAPAAKKPTSRPKAKKSKKGTPKKKAKSRTKKKKPAKKASAKKSSKKKGGKRKRR
jgi:septal ring-binding cell division protein DamX